MALAPRMQQFGTNHPNLRILIGLVMGIALVAAVTFAVMTLRSEDKIEGVPLVQSSVSVADDAVLAASRMVDVRTLSPATVRTEEQTLYAPRVTVGTPVPRSEEDEVMGAGRLLID
jgi:hypothetical protein